MLNQNERYALIAQYAEGFDVIVAALDGITEAELEAREAPGEWSPREIVHHMGDSEMITAVSFRVIMVADGSPITGYDPDEFARWLLYDRPIEDSLEAFRFARRSTLPLLEGMTDDEWRRSGVLPSGRVISAETLLTWYGPHAHAHADQIRRARKAAGNSRLKGDQADVEPT